MINWPKNPTVGQIYINPNGAKWKWNGKGWASVRESDVIYVSGPTGPSGNAFTYQFAHSFMNPVDDMTYYIGNVADQPAQSYNSVASKRVKILYGGSIKNITISTSVYGELGSGETQSFVLRNYTKSEDRIIVSNYIHATSSQVDSYTITPPLSVSKDDEVEIIWQVPVFETSPENVRHLFNAFFDTN